MSKRKESTLRRFVALEAFPQPQVVRTRYPVVLMHGFGLVASLRRGGQLHDAAMGLRAHGILAYAPNVVSYHSVAVRASMWKERLSVILDETGADRLTLIAHSMGGLDARYLISELGFHDVVHLLVTVATPHHGTSIAEYLLNRPESVRRWIVDLANWVGDSALDDASNDFLQGLAELTPAHVCESFNPAVPDHPSVTYWSYAARAGKGTSIPINPFLRFSNTLIHQREGVNDGIIPEASAHWGRFLGTIDADHAQQVGIQGLPTHHFDTNGFFRSIVEQITEAGY